jgi:SAM-dependent methyltransferase
VRRLRHGHRRRRRALLTDWLLVRGRASKPLPAAVDRDAIRAHGSSKRPSVQPGEQAILYAAVWQAVYGVVAITGEPEHDAERERLAWRFPIRPVVVLDDLDRAPPVEAAGIFPQSIWRHSHIRLTPEQFDKAAGLIAKAVVERGWDQIPDRFAEWQARIDDAERDARVHDLLARVPRGADILELGCGAGGPTTRRLAAHGRLTGVDISAEQLRRARERIPAATFIHGDAATVELPDAGFDAVVSLYALNNLPREELGPLFRRIRGWLRAGGQFLASLPASDLPAWQGDWLGVDMFFSGWDADRTLRLAAEAGLEIVDHRVEAMQEPEGEVLWLWVLASRR